MAVKIEKHKPKDCPYLHIKNCPGCGRSCACYTRRGYGIGPYGGDREVSRKIAALAKTRVASKKR